MTDSTIVIDGFVFRTGYVNHYKERKEALETKTFEGVPFKVTGYGSDIQVGDTYLAQRNTGLRLLTCKSNNHERGWIEPVEQAYLYDTGECIRIELILD